MTSAIYWFSGTGNSLHAARLLAKRLDDCRLCPIAKALADGDNKPAADRVGIVFPMYFEGLPKMVRRFCGTLCTEDVDYLFGLVTSGGGPSWALHDLRGALGGRLDAGFAVPMVGNYIAMYNAPEEDRARRKLSDAEDRIEEAARAVAGGERVMRGDTPVLGWLLHGILHRRWARRVGGRDSRFRSTGECTSCGLCARLCPAGNITLESGTPVWHHRCQGCMACIHWCPESAIEYGDSTSGRRRYHHPAISTKDMLEQVADAGEARKTGNPTGVSDGSTAG